MTNLKLFCATFIILFISVNNTFGQINFERGYFIDNDDKKTECLIKNTDWKNNPVEFEYKFNEEDKSQKGSIAFVKEFGIPDITKFKRVKAKIDRSGDDPNNLSTDPNPVWSEEQVFLKVLVEGKASLYSYQDGALKRFFYSVTDSLINQLIYKKYVSEQKNPKYNYASTSFIATNYGFHGQLLTDVTCGDKFYEKVAILEYRRITLERYFIDYNECSGNSFKAYSSKVKRDIIALKVTPGIFFTAPSIFNPGYNTSDLGYEFGNVTNFRIGLETEFILPFNMNKWGIIIEPTFQSFRAQKEYPKWSSIGSWIISINYRSIEFPFGIRYHIFLNESTKIFLDAFYISNYSCNFKSEVRLGDSNVLNITTKSSYATGGGVEFKRMSAEFRYYSDRSFLSEYNLWSSDYSRVSLIIGYKLF